MSYQSHNKTLWLCHTTFIFVLQKINRGIVMVNFYDCFVIEDCEEQNATVQDVVRKTSIQFSLIYYILSNVAINMC